MYRLWLTHTLMSPNPQNRNQLDLLQLSKRNNCIYFRTFRIKYTKVCSLEVDVILLGRDFTSWQR